MEYSQAETVIHTSNVTKVVNTLDGPLTILSGVNLRINPGESVAILGTSGSGKSTLLGLLAGLDQASSGEIELNGHPLHRLDEDQRAQVRAQQIGFIFQSFQLMPALNALENVMLPLELNGDADPRGQALRLLSQVGLEPRAKHYPSQLSGGEQQRVAIARAFACAPAILFADEPTGNLDSTTAERIIDLLFRLNAEHGTTLVLVTHDPALAVRCQRRLLLESGQLHEQTGKPDQAHTTEQTASQQEQGA